MSEVAPLVRIVGVRVLHGHVVQLTFEDGAVKVLDLEPHLWGEMFEPLRQDPELFRKVRVDQDAGTVVWPNGADLSPRMLYAEAHAVTSA